MKTIKVMECDDCPFIRFEWGQMRMVCTIGRKDMTGVRVIQTMKIPKWCPLPVKVEVSDE